MSQILIIGLIVGGRTPLDGQWLLSFDPDANNGRGDLRGTRDRSQAMTFRDAGAALDFWKLRSSVKPHRPDGKPNRPFTAFNVQIVADDVEPM